MKLKDLFEKQKVIKGDVSLRVETTKLDFKGVVVKGSFICFGTNITSLEGAPSRVGGAFNCAITKITSLKGAPSYVGGDFNCTHTAITSLEGVPSYVGKDFYCAHTGITSLHNVHRQIKHIGGKMVLPLSIRSNLIGVMFIKGLEKIHFATNLSKQKRASVIINMHLFGDRDMHACQEELIEAGLPEFAKL